MARHGGGSLEVDPHPTQNRYSSDKMDDGGTSVGHTSEGISCCVTSRERRLSPVANCGRPAPAGVYTGAAADLKYEVRAIARRRASAKFEKSKLRCSPRRRPRTKYEVRSTNFVLHVGAVKYEIRTSYFVFLPRWNHTDLGTREKALGRKSAHPARFKFQ